MLEFIFDRVFFLSLSGSAALLLILSVIFIFRRHISAKLKYRLLLLPILLFLVPVSFSLPHQTAPVAENPEMTTAPMTDSEAINAETVTDAPQTAIHAKPVKPTEEATPSPSPAFDFSRVINSAVRLLPVLWLFGLFAAAFLKTISIVRFKCGLRKIEAARSGNIIYFDGRSTPFVSGILCPKIYMPMSLDEREQNLILLHEKTHIRRGDLIVKAIAELITVVHFFNPFSYILRHITSEYMELSCDEEVTKNMDVSDRKEYGKILLTAIKKQKRCPSSAACLAENRRITKRRIELIMKPKKKSILKTLLSAFLALAVTGGSLTLASAITAKAPKKVYDSVNNNEKYVDIIKVDRTVFSDDNLLIGEFFYEKPSVSEKFTGAGKINDYFDKECLIFFEGSPEFFGENAFQQMTSLLEEDKEYLKEALPKQPYLYYVDTEVTFLSEEYVSFKQSYVWAASGPCDVFNKGVTFNLKTGEIEPITTFIAADTLENNLHNALSASTLFDVSTEIHEQAKEIYAKNSENAYTLGYDGKDVLLNENYFYDGECVNITMNIFPYPPHNGLIVKLNNNEEPSGSVYTYVLRMVDGKPSLELF